MNLSLKFQKAIRHTIYSREITRYLTKTFNLKLGKKKNPVIPNIILNNKELTKACVRGLFDTEGGLYPHHKTNLQTIFFNKEISLIFSLRKALELLNFNPRIGKNHENHCIYLFGKEAIRYKKQIGYNHQKNNIKYDCWLKNNRIPLNKEIEKECGCRELNPGHHVGNVEFYP